MNFSKHALLQASCASVLFITADAYAQNEGAPTPLQDSRFMDEIIVTAQKRQQSVTDVPIAISVLSESFLKNAGVMNAYDVIDLAPGVTGVNPSEELTQITIRGINSGDYGVGSDAAVGVFFNDVYLGRYGNTAATFIDLQQVEIVRGPQGAVLGRATPAGAILMAPNKPTDMFEANASLEIGERGRREISGVINTPINDRLSLRTVAYYDHEDGFIRNSVNGTDLGGFETYSLRSSLLIKDVAEGDLQLTAWAETSTDDGFVYTNLIESSVAVQEAVFGVVDTEIDPQEDYNIFGAIARYQRPLADGELVSITSAVGYEVDYLEDFDGFESRLFNYGQFEEQNLLTQELRYISDDAKDFRWIVGGLIYREEVGSTFIQSYDDGDLCFFYELDEDDVCATYSGQTTDTFIYIDANNRGIAGFAEGVFDITDRLTMTAGLRITRDEREFIVNSPVPGGNLDPDDVGYIIPTDGRDVVRQKTYNSLQPRLAINYKMNEFTSAYALISNGEKPGGFDTFNPYSQSFDVETLWNYELGGRGSFDKLDANWAVSTYYYDYSDLQVATFEGTQLFIENAGTASGYGLEAEISAQPTEQLFLRLSGALSHATFDSFISSDGEDFSGNNLIYSPDFTFSAFAEFRQPLPRGEELFVQLQADHSSRQYFAPSNLEFESLGPLTLFNLKLGYTDRTDRWTFTAFAENFTNEEYFGLSEETNYDSNYGRYLSLPGRPRTVGLRVDWKWHQ